MKHKKSIFVTIAAISLIGCNSITQTTTQANSTTRKGETIQISSEPFLDTNSVSCWEQVILSEKPGKEAWFQRICEEELSAEFIKSLQGALKKHGLFKGAPTGKYGPQTQQAVRSFQKPKGLDSNVLSLQAAQQLGLSIHGS